MNPLSTAPVQSSGKFRPISRLKIIGAALAVILPLFLITADASGETDKPLVRYKISVERLAPDEKGGYAYKLQYHVPVPIGIFWQFKTDFSSDHLLTNDELVDHRLVRTLGSSVITENRYASAPDLTFLWQTTVRPGQHRLEFRLLNAAECRHDFHYGTIQLSAAGNYTKVTQIAYFDFVGASLWVNYPWYGGMKSTLKKVVKWEQQMALEMRQDYLLAESF